MGILSSSRIASCHWSPYHSCSTLWAMLRCHSNVVTSSSSLSTNGLMDLEFNIVMKICWYVLPTLLACWIARPCHVTPLDGTIVGRGINTDKSIVARYKHRIRNMSNTIRLDTAICSISVFDMTRTASPQYAYCVGHDTRPAKLAFVGLPDLQITVVPKKITN